jgi:hypothetical protein
LWVFCILHLDILTSWHLGILASLQAAPRIHSSIQTGTRSLAHPSSCTARHASTPVPVPVHVHVSAIACFPDQTTSPLYLLS